LPNRRDGRAVAIEVRGLCKSFRIATRQPETLKERIVHPFRATEYRDLEVLRNISFDVRRGEFFGIVGRNGSGKSTLLKLLASIYRADRGRIRVAGMISPVIELGVGFHPEMSARDNVITNGLMLGLTPTEARRRFDEVIEFAELENFVDLKLKNYSSGMRARLAFAIATQVEPEILLLDEVLAVGDPPFARRCHDTFEDLKRRGKSTVVLVTHSVINVEHYCDRAMMLEDGSIEVQGNPSVVGARYNSLRAAPRHAKRRSRAPVEIVRMDVLGTDQTDAVEPGKPLRVRFILDAGGPVELAQLQLWITTGTGAMIFAPPPTLLEGDANRLGAGERVHIIARIENKLAPGRYSAHGLITTSDGSESGSTEMVSSAFSVPANGKPEAGFVSLDYHVRTHAVRPSTKAQ
jgi:ABC-type polysaccharide/polyol phosphate transport system ATPase subunit